MPENNKTATSEEIKEVLERSLTESQDQVAGLIKELEEMKVEVKALSEKTNDTTNFESEHKKALTTLDELSEKLAEETTKRKSLENQIKNISIKENEDTVPKNIDITIPNSSHNAKVDKAMLHRFVTAKMKSAAHNKSFVDVLKYEADRGDGIDKDLHNLITEKTMSAGDFYAGGSYIPEFMAPIFIEYLHNAAVVRKLGATVFTALDNNATIPKELSAATFAFNAEGGVKVVSDINTGDIRLNPNIMAGIVVMTNSLLRSPSAQISERVSMNMIQAAAAHEDSKFLRGTGTSNEPEGIYVGMASANQFASAGTTLANIRSDISKAIAKVKGANIRSGNFGWAMTSSRFEFLAGLEGANGNYAFPTLQGENPTLRGYPVGETENIPSNLGSGTDSEVYFGAFDNYYIADALTFMLEFFPNGTYKDSNGNIVSGISENKSVMRGETETDGKVGRADAFSLITSVAWGA